MNRDERLIVLALVGALSLLCLLSATSAHAATSPTIAIVDDSSEISRAQIADALPALQASLSQDFAPVWHADAQLELLPEGAQPADNVATITLSDNVDCWDCYGYHDVSESDIPYAMVFPGLCLENGEPWTLVFDHEAKEMLADPKLSRVEWNGQHWGLLYLLEVADPVESRRLAYSRPAADGFPVPLSDFVTENWYRAGSEPPYDFRGRLGAPERLARGGYVSFWANGFWQQRYRSDESSPSSSFRRSPSITARSSRSARRSIRA